MLRLRLHPFYEADKGDNGDDTTHEKSPETQPEPEQRDIDAECDQYIGELLDHIDKLTTRIDELERGRDATNPSDKLPEPEPEPEESHWYFRKLGKR